jgi:hypothetical protein
VSAQVIPIELAELVSDSVNSISGRSFGEGYAKKKDLVGHLEKGDTFLIKIDSDKIKAINDSFWKGFFNDVFKLYHTKEEVLNRFQFDSNEYFLKLINKNLAILDAIYH